jgi:hypothetical protein
MVLGELFPSDSVRNGVREQVRERRWENPEIEFELE